MELSTRFSWSEVPLLFVAMFLSLLFISISLEYLKSETIIGIFIILEAVMSMLLFFFIRWGYATLSGVIAVISFGALLLLKPPTVYLGKLPLYWWVIGILYLVIIVFSIILVKQRDEKMLTFISLFFTLIFLFMGFTAAYEGFRLSLPPDVLRGLSASTKIKTWRSMGILLGLMNMGAAISMSRGKYLHYLLLISFTLPPLFTVSLSFGNITFGMFSQVLLLTQVGISGLMVSWYTGSKR